MAPKWLSARREPPGCHSPTAHLAPQPDMNVRKTSHRFRELWMAAAPVMDDLRTLNVESSRDLGSVDEVIDVHPSAHGRNSTYGERQ